MLVTNVSLHTTDRESKVIKKKKEKKKKKRKENEIKNGSPSVDKSFMYKIINKFSESLNLFSASSRYLL